MQKGTLFGGIFIGIILAICIALIVVAVIATVNHVGIAEQVVTWLGGTMPAEEVEKSAEIALNTAL